MSGERCCLNSCSVRTGTMIIAVISIVFMAYSFGNSAYFLIQWLGDPDAFLHYHEDNDVKKTLEENRTSVIIYVVFNLITSGIDIIFSALMFRGAKINDAKKCLPWLYYNYFLFGLNLVVAGIFAFIFLFISIILLIIYVLIVAIPLGIWAYMLFVVKRYVDLDQGRNAGQIYFYQPPQTA